MDRAAEVIGLVLATAAVLADVICAAALAVWATHRIVRRPRPRR